VLKKKPKKKEIYRINGYLILSIVLILLFVIFIFVIMRNQKVAIVNNEEITKEDLDFILKFVPENQRSGINQKTLIDQAIAMKLINQDAMKKGIVVSDDEVEFSIKKLLNKSNINESEFKRLLKKQGLTLEDVKRMQRYQLVAAKLMDATVMQNISITEKDIKDFYETYKSQLNASFDEVKDDIKVALTLQKANNAFLIYIQQLRANADIRIY